MAISHRLISFLLGEKPPTFADQARFNRIFARIALVLLGLFLGYLGICLLVTASTMAERRASFPYTEVRADQKDLPEIAPVYFVAQVRGQVSDPELGLHLDAVRYRRQTETFHQGRWGIPAFTHSDDAKDCQVGNVKLGGGAWVDLLSFQPYVSNQLPGYIGDGGPGYYRKSQAAPAEGDQRIILTYIPNGTFSFMGMLDHGVLISGTAIAGQHSAEELLTLKGVAKAEDIARQRYIGAGLIYLGLFLAGLARGPLTGILLSAVLATGCAALLGGLSSG